MPTAAVSPTPRVADIASVCAALADPTRLRILALLGAGEVCVCHLHESLGVPQPTASRHLAYLRKAGLVEGRRDGLWVHYRVASDLPGHVRHAVDAVLHAARHCPEPSADGRELARATGKPVGPRLPTVVGCCAPPAQAQVRRLPSTSRGERA